jgi:hypothetical protein
VAKQPKGELVVIGFNYDLLETKLADKVRTAADRIRERVKKTVEDIIEVGNDLLAVKETLPHGQFLPWLRAEFGWSERSAENFMSVADRFKSAKIADLPIQPSAAYFLGTCLARPFSSCTLFRPLPVAENSRVFRTSGPCPPLETNTATSIWQRCHAKTTGFSAIGRAKQVLSWQHPRSRMKPGRRPSRKPKLAKRSRLLRPERSLPR